MREIAAGRQSVAVVASMGVYDEDAVVARSSRSGFVALVASRDVFKPCAICSPAQGYLKRCSMRIKAPAGLDISASSPEEIAVSILAEIISRREHLPAIA